MRTSTMTWLTVIPFVAALAACATKSAPEERYGGTIRSGCAPHDAPSTEIQLDAPGGSPLVSFNLWPRGGVVPPTTVTFDTTHPVGQGTFCTSPDACESAVRGKVVLESLPGDSVVSGSWTMEMQDGRVYRGMFTADWLAIQALCG